MSLINPLSLSAAYPSGKRKSFTLAPMTVTVLPVLLICRLTFAHIEPNTLLSFSVSISAARNDILSVLKLSISGLNTCIVILS
jgi:hypothetical protein